MTTTANFAPLVQRFFSQRLVQQRRVSPHTLASYRDTFCQLLKFAEQRLKKRPSALALSDFDATVIGEFLEHLEQTRQISAATRNLRLTAVRSFFRFATYSEPSCSGQIQQILAIPSKRQARPLVGFLTRNEMEAVLAAPNQTTWYGRRDHALLRVAFQTGLRVSELTGLHRQDAVLGIGAHVRCEGKGRKERATPLTPQTAETVKQWMDALAAEPSSYLFPTKQGQRMSADAVQYLVAKHVKAARQVCPSLSNKRVTPHVMRHTAAMELLQSGTDLSVIALFLGHESIKTTNLYLDAHLALKEAALAKIEPLNGSTTRFHPDDKLLQFLKNL
jgi:integrase/recombinase XerD